MYAFPSCNSRNHVQKILKANQTTGDTIAHPQDVAMFDTIWRANQEYFSASIGQSSFLQIVFLDVQESLVLV